jgi:hypothetical protein
MRFPKRPCSGRLTFGVGRHRSRYVRFTSRGRRVRLALDAASARALRRGAAARVSLVFGGGYAAAFRYRR